MKWLCYLTERKQSLSPKPNCSHHDSAAVSVPSFEFRQENTVAIVFFCTGFEGNHIGILLLANYILNEMYLHPLKNHCPSFFMISLFLWTPLFSITATCYCCTSCRQNLSYLGQGLSLCYVLVWCFTIFYCRKSINCSFVITGNAFLQALHKINAMTQSMGTKFFMNLSTW